MSKTNKEWIFTELKKATMGLTTTTISELTIVFGEGSLDELAMDFNNFLTAATPFLEDTDSKGLELLQDVDNLLDKISGTHNLELWTESAFLDDQNWADIRRSALIVVNHFEWS